MYTHCVLCAQSLNHVRLFATPWTVGCQAPLSGDSPDKNTGVSCHALLQWIFPTQGLNPGLPLCRQILYHLGHQGSPVYDQESAEEGFFHPEPELRKKFLFCLPLQVSYFYSWLTESVTFLWFHLYLNGLQTCANPKFACSVLYLMY